MRSSVVTELNFKRSISSFQQIWQFKSIRPRTIITWQKVISHYSVCWTYQYKMEFILNTSHVTTFTYKVHVDMRFVGRSFDVVEGSYCILCLNFEVCCNLSPMQTSSTWTWKNSINFTRKLQIIGIVEKEKCCFVQKFCFSWAVHVVGKDGNWNDINMKLIKNMELYKLGPQLIVQRLCCHIYLWYISMKQLNHKMKRHWEVNMVFINGPVPLLYIWLKNKANKHINRVMRYHYLCFNWNIY